MNRFQSTHIYLHSFFMMLFAVAAMFHTLWGSAGLVFALLVGAPLTALSLLAGRQYGRTGRQANKQAVNAVAIFGIALFALTLSEQGLLPALLILIVCIQLAQNFILCTEREVYFSIAIVLMLVLYSASESTSGFFVIYIMIFSLSCTFVLVALHAEKIAGASHQPAETKRHNNAVFPASIMVLGMSILAVTLLIYMAIPQLAPAHIGSSFGVYDHYYQDESWEREARADGEPDTSSPDDARTTAGAGDTGDKHGQATPSDGVIPGPGVNDGRNPGSGPVDGGDRFFRERAGETAGSTPREAGKDAPGRERGAASDPGVGETTSNDSTDGDSSRQTSDRFQYAGFESQMDIEDQGNPVLSNAIILYVQADEGVYLRSHVFDTFDGQRWHETLDTVEKYASEAGNIDFVPLWDTSGLLRQSVIYEQVVNSRIVAANFPVRLQFPGSVVAAAHDGVLSSPRTIQAGTRYTVYSDSERVLAHPASRREPLTHSENYLQVPARLDPRVAALVESLTADLTPFEAALVLEEHLRTGYRYTLDTVLSSQGVTPLDTFLFERKEGHCEYFASAMTIMLRLHGIPARLVTGFSATNRNPLTGYFEVRGLDAHAWVEAYFPEHGWVTFEPTPAYFLPKPSEVKTTAESFKDYLEHLQAAESLLKESRRAEASDRLSVKGLLSASRESLLYLVNVVFMLILQGLDTVKVPLLATVAMAAASTALFHVFRCPLLNFLSLQKVRSLSLREPGIYVRKVYAETEGLLSRKGRARAASATLEEYQQVLRDEVFFRSLEVLCTLYSRVDYGNYHPTRSEALVAKDCYLAIYKSA